ncbi:hypothetical protein DNK47_00670 [Mycoplasma wenyonii]|uniref:Uncharacterized protein n=1 Tax=Mycoplasma wenyonii TaxID=65123 RepID=A0A328PR54_9MOLU|nr:hypothetical protein [Mycoplasma wenyonii]RAO95348.1 hypothetical protein DNK47_00670 [Mycoplasma wenyonii]
MQKLSTLEKKEILAGFAKSTKTQVVKPKAVSQRVPSQLDSKLYWLINNVALIALTTVPWLITFGEGIYSLVAKKPNSYSNYSGEGRSYGGGFGSMDARRSYYAYASEAFRPTMRFSPMPYSNGITFGMPWLN